MGTCWPVVVPIIMRDKPQRMPIIHGFAQLVCSHRKFITGLVQTIFGIISVIVTLGGGGGGVKPMTLRKFYCPQVLRNI